MTTYPARPGKTEPLHPGAVAADLIDGKVSPRQAAIAIGLTPAGLGKVLNGKGPVTTETALRFAAYFGNTAQHWLAMQAAYDVWHTGRAMQAELRRIKPLDSD